MTITEFLLARIDAEEAWTRRYAEKYLAEGGGPEDARSGFCWPPTEPRWADFPYDKIPYREYPHPTMMVGYERVLAECEAKRRTIAELAEGVEFDIKANDPPWNASMEAAGRVLQHLAAIYADHPDCLEEWRA